MGSTNSKRTHETSPQSEFAGSIENHSEDEKDVKSEKLQRCIIEMRQ